ncbi:MAG: RES family NAD+ phosphorylase, partial [Parahaliea sp.]
MILYKIIKTPFVAGWTDYRKTASFRRGGRWNSPGQPAMYLSSSVQTAMLEIAHYALSPRMANKLYRLVVFQFPELRLHRLPVSDLPQDWDHAEHHFATQAIGDALLRAGRHEGIVVPTTSVHPGITKHPNRDI